ncbi:hemerythrin domain-containing protein [Catellatospora methionotrophica]|uniref:hemerythrin domain-containing protein n=1 Tax=Catellatospora methionotrophica TaxID=121620 RepID=UPI0033E6DEA5
MTRPQVDDNPLLAELRWVHNMLRRDLAAVRRLADEAAGGAPARDLQQGLRKLQSNGPLFQLKINCLSYCQFVHHHHQAEDAMMFPAVRRAAPHLRATVDRLEADHRVVSDLLDQVEGAARALGGDDAEIRAKLVVALRTLSDKLLEHLEFEEGALGPVLKTWKRWPFHG